MLISSESFLSSVIISRDHDKILKIYKMRENNYYYLLLSFHDVVLQKQSLFEIVLDRIFNCQPIFNFCSIFYDTLSAQFCWENILSTSKNFENICKILLSDTRNEQV